MKTIQIYGPGCLQCRQLTEDVRAAVAELGIASDVQEVTDINAIIAAGVWLTPALAVDGKVLVAGTAPPLEEVKRLLRKALVGD